MLDAVFLSQTSVTKNFLCPTQSVHSCIKHTWDHKCIPTHSLLTLPSISVIRHSGSGTPSRISALRSKIHCLQLCPSLLHDLKLPALSAGDMHTSTTHFDSNALACILTNLTEAITRLSSSCWPAIKCLPFPFTNLCISFSSKASLVAASKASTWITVSFSRCCLLEGSL